MLFHFRALRSKQISRSHHNQYQFRLRAIKMQIKQMQQIKNGALHKFRFFSRDVWRTFNEQQCFNRAAALAYTTLLAFVPLLVVSFSMFMAFPQFNAITQQAKHVIISNFVASSAHVVQEYLNLFIEQARQLSMFGMLSLLATAIFLIMTVEQSFNAIWRIEKHRGGVAAFLLYWGAITLIPVLVGIGFVTTSFLLALPILQAPIVQSVIGMLVTYLAAFVAFVLLYAALPNCKVPLRASLSGASVAAVLFEVAKQAFALYIVKFSDYQLIYGALALVPIFLIWLFISWVVILCGVVVSYVITKNYNSSDESSNSGARKSGESN